MSNREAVARLIDALKVLQIPSSVAAAGSIDSFGCFCRATTPKNLPCLATALDA
jgi:hypothetical protein